MDSMKVYRGMDIGTDKPSAELQARAPFGLLDLVGHEEAFSAGRWVEAACAAAETSEAPVLFAGGTPLYLRLLVEGLFPGPPGDPELRAELERLWDEQGERVVRAQLASVDPALEARLMPGDRKRLVRGLEVHRISGRALSDWQREETRPALPGRFVLVALRWEREAHGRRIDARIETMFERGLLREVAALAARAPFAPEPARAIGYAETLDVLAGRCTERDAIERMRTRTRQLVKKQGTFLRSFADLRWIDIAADEELEQVLPRVERALELRS